MRARRNEGQAGRGPAFLPRRGWVLFLWEERGCVAKGWYRLPRRRWAGQQREASVPGGSADSGANILSFVPLWPPSDLEVKLQSSPTAMITCISLLYAAMSCFPPKATF